MRYTVETTKKFDKAFKLCKRRGYRMELLLDVVNILATEGSLPSTFHPHKLSGFKGNRTWECHIEPDWLLVWEQNEDRLTLLMLDTGTHADLF